MKIDIYSGFLGAGKTTLIKKMIQEGYQGQKLVLIENEFGEIGIDGGFLQDAGINITEMNSGCICCSLVGDFGKALEKVIAEYHPDRVIIEPSGVGKLSDVIGAVKKVVGHDVELGYAVAVADAGKVKVYMKNFGEFYNNQIETASTIVLSRTTGISEKKLDTALELLREHNDHATIVTTPWEDLSGEQLIAAFEGEHTLAKHMEETEHEHHHHHHDHEEHCCCGHDHEHHHHHEHSEECGCGHHHEHEHHHHHDHDEHCCCGHDHDHEHHHHHHEHGEECTCGCHDHDHHHHHADEVFSSWGVETTKIFTRSTLEEILVLLSTGAYGTVLRAKGIVRGHDRWLEFDYVPGEWEIRHGKADYTGKLCVIGSNLNDQSLANLFGV